MLHIYSELYLQVYTQILRQPRPAVERERREEQLLTLKKTAINDLTENVQANQCLKVYLPISCSAGSSERFHTLCCTCLPLMSSRPGILCRKRQISCE